jgi:hypothetical protein
MTNDTIRSARKTGTAMARPNRRFPFWRKSELRVPPFARTNRITGANTTEVSITW